ncbi:DUF2970 domain-containing protein [Ferrimonas balearica]|uniref:DUF2970 domain-containing protein n=1 Tax=Ferrimonas balearica TaxID=44012 RepID=UPI001C98B560|nr:DUF2970 domain-containing protein [Ferrimonas balearica]MBY5981121.1 DUF2970 domain-containing protein [Ferrimonas balearica]
MRVVWSVLAAMFGVQSERNRERDFTDTSPLPYIITGVIMLVLFVLSLIWLVNQILSGPV